MVAEKLKTDKSDAENNLTISTKLSTDQLICKSPQTSSLEGSIKSLRNIIPIKDADDANRKRDETPIALYFGVLQILFGLLMAVFGVLVLVHNASLSQIGGGLWGGCLATLTGVMGVLSAAKDCCPLKTNPQKIALTAFLALSLISLAVANLVLVLAAIGLARDANRTDGFNEEDNQASDASLTLPSNYSALLSSSGLLLISACEVIVAALSAYHCTRTLCPCFKSADDKECECGNGSTVYSAASINGKDLLVSSWLGKQQMTSKGVHGIQPVYVVTTNRRKRGTPVLYPMPTPPSSLLAPQMVGYPLMPAPLGITPPPFLHAHPHPPPEKIHKKRRRYPSDRQLQQQIAKPQEKPKKKKEKQKTITEEEVAKTYTGLDRVIAEEFIQICDSAKNTSGSDTSGTGCTGSDTLSNEYIIEKL